MSLKVYGMENHLGANRRVEIVAEMLNVPIEKKRIPGTEWKGEEHLKRNPFGKVPAMETPEGPIFESLTLMRYLARKAGKMYGANPFETAQIDQWLEYFNTNLMPVIYVVYPTTFGYKVYPKDQFEDALREVKAVLKVMDNQLKNTKFLGSNEINIADVAFAVHLRALLRLYINEAARKELPNFMKWFNEVSAHPVFMKQLGKVWFCQKEFVPDFTYGKEEKKKEEKPKKEKGEKKPEKKKEEAPKKKEKKAEVEEEEEAPKEKKKVNPLDELPKSNFNLDEFKKDFVNAEDHKAALKEFWGKYDPEGWSIWKTHYIRYEGEGKVGYLTGNLKNGFLRNIDHFRKYTFCVLGVYGVEGDYNIDGVWLWRGTEIPNEWKEHQSFEYFEFTKLDHTKEEHRKLVEDYWTCLNEGDMVDGHPFYEGKWFK